MDTNSTMIVTNLETGEKTTLVVKDYFLENPKEKNQTLQEQLSNPITYVNFIKDNLVVTILILLLIFISFKLLIYRFKRRYEDKRITSMIKKMNELQSLNK